MYDFYRADLIGELWGNGCVCSNSACSNCEEVPMGLEGNECFIVDGSVEDPIPDNPIAF